MQEDYTQCGTTSLNHNNQDDGKMQRLDLKPFQATALWRGKQRN